jgi:site-specific DNA recombinase
MLAGLLFDRAGTRYIPTHAQKGGRRYHYYTSQTVIKGDKDDLIGRLPAPALEGAVAERIWAFFRSQAEILDAAKQLDSSEVSYDKLLRYAEQRSSEWTGMPQSERAYLIRAMLNCVIVHEGSLELQLDLEAAIQVVLGKTTRDKSKKDNVQTFSLKAPLRHIGQGKSETRHRKRTFRFISEQGSGRQSHRPGAVLV